MLSVDWTPGDQKKYETSECKTVPDYHLPTKAVIAVPWINNKWDVFWSEHGKYHAEDYLFDDISFSKIKYFRINFTPCAKRCTPNFIRLSEYGGCPRMYVIWPYKISPKGIERDQVTAIYNLNKRCAIFNWNDFSSFVDAICALREKKDLLCSDVKKAIKSKAFKQRNDYSLNLMRILKSEEPLDKKEQTLQKIMNDYKKENYPG